MSATAPQFRIQRHESPTRAQLDLARDIWAARQRAPSVDQRHRHVLAGGGVAGHVGVESYSPMLRNLPAPPSSFPGTPRPSSASSSSPVRHGYAILGRPGEA